MIPELTAIAKDLGPYAALAVFLLYMDYRRQNRQEKRLDEAREEAKALALKVVEVTTKYDTLSEATRKAVANNTEALDRLSIILERYVGSNPCIQNSKSPHEDDTAIIPMPQHQKHNRR